MAKILAILIYYQSSPLICQFISPQHCTSSQTVPVSNHSDALFKRCFCITASLTGKRSFHCCFNSAFNGQYTVFIGYSLLIYKIFIHIPCMF